MTYSAKRTRIHHSPPAFHLPHRDFDELPRPANSNSPSPRRIEALAPKRAPTHDNPRDLDE
jgi:hypothetical protein